MYKRLEQLLIEALSGASKAYRNQTRNWYKKFSKPSSPEVKAKASKTWGKVRQAKNAVPQSKSRIEARSSKEYQNYNLAKMPRRAMKEMGNLTETKRDVNKLKDWADKNHIK